MCQGKQMRTLRWRWGAVAVGYVISAAVGAWGLARLGETWHLWLTGAVVTAAYQLIRVWQLLPLNHLPDGKMLFSSFGRANLLTLTRGVPQLLLGGLLIGPTPSGWLRWMPVLLYGLTILGDHFDGYLARTGGRVTVIGARLDMAYDALAMVLISGVGVRYGVLPWWYLAVPLARPLFVLGIWLRRRLHRAVAPLPYSATRRMVASLQMGFLAGVMAPLFDRTATRWLTSFFMAPLIGSFLRDWGLVSGWLDPTSNLYRRRLRTLGLFLTQRLPLALRLVVVPLTLLARKSWPESVQWVALISSGLMALGLVGRTASGVFLIAVSLATLRRSVNGFDVILLALGTALLFLGTGPFAVWSPERRLLMERAGE
jgi:CDP-diacylglycerol---glycerol-3-phosphate 3-phosphatidyltransferase